VTERESIAKTLDLLQSLQVLPIPGGIMQAIMDELQRLAVRYDALATVANYDEQGKARPVVATPLDIEGFGSFLADAPKSSR